ncbi:uncharacterized protein LOC134256425 [Saccostrea cucullata]|uniref:uncharacterized protein LOC134256425 n=1 Tax=Saccostrea cuccullata TaxID=36930 RepID=UPI002ED3BCA5
MDDVSDAAQHYIECDTALCRNFSEFYCNTCHQRICGLCRENHLKRNKGHDIVPYQEKKRKLPSEKCKTHPTFYIDIYCDDCQVPVCPNCLAQDHNDHANCNLEIIYNNTLKECQKEIIDIWKTVIPKATDNIKSFGEEKKYTMKEIANLRLSMKKRANELKEAVDAILTANNKKLDEIENLLLNDLEENQKKTEDFIAYLKKIITDYENKMSSIRTMELFKFYFDISSATLKRPTLSKLKLPTFNPGTTNEEEIATEFGEIETDSYTKILLSSSAKKVNEIRIHASAVSHLSSLLLDRFWAGSDWKKIIQSDMQGNTTQEISNSIWCIRGNHTVNTEGELLYSDYKNSNVCRVRSNLSINKLVSTGNWEPGAIFSSNINGHILVGMERNRCMKVTRYSKRGKKLQDIQRDNKGKDLFQSINFISENINGDICTSDYLARKVVLVTGSGEYRFSYSGHHSQFGFIPYGICTDVLGHILVCNGYEDSRNHCSSVHLLDMDGQFLSLLLTPDQCDMDTCALCIDKHHNLLVGGLNSSTISVYKYLEKT